MKRIVYARSGQILASSAVFSLSLFLLWQLATAVPPIVPDTSQSASIGVVDFGEIKKEFDKIVVEIHGKDGMEKLISSIVEDEHTKPRARGYIENMAYQHFVRAVNKNATERKFDLVVNSFDPQCPTQYSDIQFKPNLAPGYVLFHSDRVHITEEVRQIFRTSVVKFVREMIVE